MDHKLTVWAIFLFTFSEVILLISTTEQDHSFDFLSPLTIHSFLLAGLTCFLLITLSGYLMMATQIAIFHSLVAKV